VLDLAGPSMGMLNQNEKLKNLISVTPFEDVNPDIQTDKLYYAPIFEGGKLQGTVVPNSGIVEKLYFNTNMPVSELKEILNSSITWTDASVLGPSLATAGFEFYPVLAYTRPSGSTVVPFVLAMKRYTRDITDHKAGEIEMGLVEFTTLSEVEGFYVDSKGGWRTFNNPFYLGFEVLPELSGLPIGFQNEVLKNIISTTPFEIVGAEMTGYDYHKFQNGKWVTFGLTINKNVDGVINIKPIGRSGSISKLCFNTSLSINEIYNIFEQIPLEAYTDSDGIGLYAVASLNIDAPNTSIILIKLSLGEANLYILMYGDLNFNLQNMLGAWCPEEYKDTIESQMGFNVGWNTTHPMIAPLDENMSVELSTLGYNDVILLETLGDDTCGTHNDIIKEIVAEDWELYSGKIPVLEISGKYDEEKLELFGSNGIKTFGDIKHKKIVTEIKNTDYTELLFKHKYDLDRYKYLFHNFEGNQKVWDKFKNFKLTEPIKVGDYMFWECDGLETLPFDVDISVMSSGEYMFGNCKKCTNLPNVSTRLVNGRHMYYNCKGLTSFTRGVTAENGQNELWIGNMFEGCTNLEFVSISETIYTGDLSDAFRGCENLESIQTIVGEYGISLGANDYTFYNCKKLKHLSIKNINCNLKVGDGTPGSDYEWGHQLTFTSLFNLCKECIDCGHRNVLKVGKTNMNKLSNTYVKLTGAAEENESYPKLPMQQCSSTEEGAMLLTDYMRSKNWYLQS
jgi:hypothetical protein